ncbi:hypothetical protein [Telmatospirillum sp.]|uniref:hypothetical protein n=1 Tax=Telmatospirillum sp. TaxID=2079197 RepID=UPI0028419745|nr:hypothetical protein [Telmatospirillum sp.]MDR3436252.1 hypothetical protein [Telmatospirillum sp.]
MMAGILSERKTGEKTPSHESPTSGDRGARRSSPIGHKFKVGQTLRFVPGAFESGSRPGNYTIVRLLPPEGGENQYRIKNSLDGHERVVREHQLS